jgi:adenosylmethionine-8-amino-7-oxononanoate aminotransferase
VTSTRIFHRQPGHVLPVAVAGDGPYIVDGHGKRYLDASGGAGVSCLGHTDRRVIDAIKTQLDRLPYAHTGFFTNEPAEELAAQLISRAPKGLGHVYFASGGSEANETAMKLARQYFWERGETGRRHFIARRQSYHGNTIATLSVGGNAGRRAIYEPILMPASHIGPCYAYRHRGEEESEEAYGIRAADELEAEILRLGPETVIAFIAETVVGATAGAVPPVAGYLQRIRDICDRYGVLLILDEVMCGMGRTGTLHACEQDGVAPDILTCAKGLGAGYQPIGACLLSREIHDAIVGGSGAFQHGFTYVAHAAAAAGALAVQRVIDERDLLARCRELGSSLRTALAAQFGEHPHVGDIRGRGLFLALELVEDRVSKRPFDAGRRLHALMKAAAMDQGLMVYPSGGTADGRAGDHILIAPPFIIDQDQIGELVDKLSRALEAALAAR